ncbi:hypothetical protein ABK040_007563 [Willaertia magna]
MDLCQHHSSDMNVWRQLIENNSPVDLQTTLHTHGFSFLLDKTVFTDSKIDRTCYVQSFARLIGVRRNAESVLVDFNAPNSINYFVVSTNNTVSNSTSVITSPRKSQNVNSTQQLMISIISSTLQTVICAI